MLGIESVKTRLEGLGYIVKDLDAISLEFCVQKVANTIKNDCNVLEVPEGLTNIAIDMVIGEFLLGKKTFSPSDLDSLNVDAVAKSIKLGDTNIEFGSSADPEKRLDILINWLITHGKGEFACYRKVRW